MSFLKNIANAFVPLIEIAPYTIVENKKKSDNYEERTVPPQKWVSIKKKGIDYDEAVGAGFWSLFRYIGGENESKTKIEMTAPVVAKVEPGAGPNCESTFTISFYVPAEFQENTPKPTNPDLFIEEWPAMSLISRRFGGYAKPKIWIEEAFKLGEAVTDNGIKVREDFYYTAGYDAPFKVFNRRNEVWFVKEEQ